MNDEKACNKNEINEETSHDWPGFPFHQMTKFFKPIAWRCSVKAKLKRSHT